MSLQALELNDARRSHDPTGTAALRRTWRSVAEIRLRQLRAQLRIAVVEQDLLGLGGGLAQYTPAHVRLKAMQDWFERTAATTMGGAWSTPYVASAWQSGHAGAMKETRKVATLDHFSSEHLAQLAQAEFTGIAAALAQQVNRAAVEAVTLELRPTRAYALMVRPFDKQAVHRVRTNVSVIVVKAHNEAKLAAYREMGVTRVGIDPETRKRKVTHDHVHDAFNPDEPRDEHGEWTSGGGGAQSAQATGKWPPPWHKAGWTAGEKFAQPPALLKIVELTKVGQQMGSNAGGVYADASGKKFYVKQGKSADHVRNEMLAVKLYQLAGTPLLHYREVEGGKHIATEIEKLDKKNANALSPQERVEATKDFAVHAWLANWDVVGLGGDNIGTTNGQPIPLDLGGALAYRAQGAPKGKAFGDTAGEIDTLRDPGVNPDSAHMFGGMTPAQLRESASFVTKITDREIRDVVKESGSSDALADRLIKRRDDIAQRAKTFGTEGDPTKSSSTVVFAAGDPLPVKALNGIKFKPWSLPEGTSWNDVDGQADLGEAELSEHQANHKQLASGLVIREPDGRIWLVRPKNAFGGYQHTFPKGRVEADLSLQANAIKEAWEETGIKARITGLIGERRGSFTLTRFYMAERESGEPTPDGKESDGVALVPPNRLGAFLNRTRDKELAAAIAGGMAHDAFDPGEPRDPHGEWTGGGSEPEVLAYHGASSKIIKSVTKNGIIVGRDKNVWVAANKSTASLFAETKSKAGAHPVVFEVNVPRDKWTQFKELKNNGPTWKGGSNTASSTQKIPPEWIAGYHEVDPNTGKMNPTLKSLTKDALVEEMPTTLYVVVVPEPEALPEHTTDSTTLFDRPMSKGPGSQTSREDVPSPSTIYRIEKAQEALEEEVGEEVDILTAGDELVCEECQDIADGGPYTLDEAQGLIPRHANCRCAFRPAADLRFAHDAAFEAAGVMFFTPDGRVLFVKRTDGEGWALPAGGVEPGEEPLQAAQREAAEEVGWPGDHQAAQIDRRTTNGVDFRTFLQPVAEPFDPLLNREHSEALWAPLETPPNPVHPGLAATIRSLLEPSSGGRNVHGVVHDAVRARVAVSAPVGAARFGRFPGRRFSYARGGVSSVLSSVLSDYSPDQPRVPAGSPGGGEWGSGEGSDPAVSFAAAEGDKDKYGLDEYEQDDMWAWKSGAGVGRQGYDRMRKDPEWGKTLAKLPAYSGTVYRGLDLRPSALAKLEVGGTFEIDKHSAATPSRAGAKNFAYGEHDPVLLEMDVKSARRIPDMYSTAGSGSENEVVVLKGATFKVTGRKQIRGDEGRPITVVQMRQVTAHGGSQRFMVANERGAHITEQVAGKAVDPEMLKALNAGLDPYAKVMEKRCKEVAAAMNVDPDLVSVSTGTQQSELGVAAAVTNNNTGKVTMFAQYCNPKTFAGVLAHELEHVKYAQYRKAFKAEQAQVDAMSDDEVRAAYAKGELGLYREFAEIYDIPKLREEDGVSTYSAQWWAKYDASSGKWSSSAVHETLAEMARKKLETGELPGGPRFQALYNVVRSFWHDRKPQGYHV